MAQCWNLNKRKYSQIFYSEHISTVQDMPLGAGWERDKSPVRCFVLFFCSFTKVKRIAFFLAYSWKNTQDFLHNQFVFHIFGWEGSNTVCLTYEIVYLHRKYKLSLQNTRLWLKQNWIGGGGHTSCHLAQWRENVWMNKNQSTAISKTDEGN